MTRQQKTPKQRAEEALGVANRAVIKLDRKVDALRTQLATATAEQQAAIARRDHLKKHPDLDPTKSNTAPPTPTGDK